MSPASSDLLLCLSTASADNEMEFDDRVNAVEIATQFQESAKQVLGDVADATDAVKTQVLPSVPDLVLLHLFGY